MVCSRTSVDRAEKALTIVTSIEFGTDRLQMTMLAEYHDEGTEYNKDMERGNAFVKIIYHSSANKSMDDGGCGWVPDGPLALTS